VPLNDRPGIFVHGIGAVSPAGWGMDAFRNALAAGVPIPAKDLPRPGWDKPLTVRSSPAPTPRPAFLAHPRLRRTSPIAQYVVATALEALGHDAEQAGRNRRLGIVFCAMSGCVNYSRRFYDETLKDPSTASPLVFPETVYNAPASHLAAVLGTTAINYTVVGDPGEFLVGISIAADWLATGRVDGCLVIGAEEIDWLMADAMRLFDRKTIVSDGAGALYLKRERPAGAAVQLEAITNAEVFYRGRPRSAAARSMRLALPSNSQSRELLCDGTIGLPRADRDEEEAWADWPHARLSVKKVFGEGFMAAAAWQCIAAVDALQRPGYAAANVSIVGCNQQAIGARFIARQ